jgi:hypothetical protein
MEKLGSRLSNRGPCACVNKIILGSEACQGCHQKQNGSLPPECLPKSPGEEIKYRDKDKEWKAEAALHQRPTRVLLSDSCWLAEHTMPAKPR